MNLEIARSSYFSCKPVSSTLVRGSPRRLLCMSTQERWMNLFTSGFVNICTRIGYSNLVTVLILQSYVTNQQK